MFVDIPSNIRGTLKLKKELEFQWSLKYMNSKYPHVRFLKPIPTALKLGFSIY